MLGSNPGLLRLFRWQPDALTTRLDLIHNGWISYTTARSHPSRLDRQSTPHPPPHAKSSLAVEQEYSDDIASGIFFISRWSPPSPPPSCPTSTASPSQRTTPSSSSIQSSLIPRQEGGEGTDVFANQKNPLQSFRNCGWSECVRNPVLKFNSWTKSRQNSYEFSSFLFTVTSIVLPWYFYFFKFTSVTVHC